MSGQRLPLAVACVSLAAVLAPALPTQAEPTVGVGLLITREDVPRLREKVKTGVPALMWAQVEATVASARGALGKVQYPAEETLPYPKAGELSPVVENLPLVAFHYLMTRDAESGRAAREALVRVSRYRRAGWFTWDGGSWPHIDAGRLNRVMVLGYDWAYDALSEQDREAVRAFLAAAVQDFFRLNLFVPGAPMHHFRSYNQGNNQLSSAVLAALALRGHHRDADWWLRGLIQTLSWSLTEHMGPFGQDFEPDLSAYWMISVDGLVQAAVALRNVTGIDLTSHPHLRSAVEGIIIHLAPCPPVQYNGREPVQDDAYDRNWAGWVWVQDKPACTPHRAQVGATFLFLASAYSDGRALELWRGTYMPDGQRLDRNFASMPHIGLTGAALSILWYPEKLAPQPIEAPLARFTDRLGMMRTGYNRGDGYLLFNGGDLTLIAGNELLGTGLGLVWHHPLYQYAKAQNCVWTEGEPLQPSFRVTDSLAAEGFQYLSAEASTSNAYYYRKREQSEAYRHFRELRRDIVSVGGQYYVMLDQVETEDPRAHTWVWHTLNTDHRASISWEGRQATVHRPAQDLSIFFVEPQELTFEQDSQPLMPVWYFAWGDLGQALLARAGRDTPPPQPQVFTAGAVGWKPYDPETQRFDQPQGSVRTALVEGPQPKTQALRLTDFADRPSLAYERDSPALEGAYYRAELLYRKQNLQHYHNPSWLIGVQFLDANGRALNQLDYGDFEAAVVEDRNYDVDDLDWTVSARRFRAPAGARTMRFVFLCAENPSLAPGAKRDVTPSLDLARFTVTLQGMPSRQQRQRFLTILAPHAPDAAAPAVAPLKLAAASGCEARGAGYRDTILAPENTAYEGPLGTIAAQLCVLRGDEKGTVRQVLATAATRVAVAGLKLESGAPLSVAYDVPSRGGILRVHDTAQVRLGAGKARELTEGVYRLAAGGRKLVLAPEADASFQPSAEAVRAFREGLGPWVARLAAERDQYRGRSNLALQAQASASGSCEPRFGPERVRDNLTDDAYGDGTIRYDQPGITTAELGGYGRGYDPLYGMAYPYRILPTYWLAPHEAQEPWVQLTFARDERVHLVRLLNTTNGGFNDRATIDFRVDLLAGAGQTVGSRTGHFGRPLPGPVTDPEPPYSECYRFWYDPATPVPFGEGFQDITFDNAPKARAVRVTILRYWGFGGGLNEVQAYGP